jgi:hypothetical protein
MQELNSYFSKLNEFIEQSHKDVNERFAIFSDISAKMCKSHHFGNHISRQIYHYPNSDYYHFIITDQGLQIVKIETDKDNKKLRNAYNDLKDFNSRDRCLLLQALPDFILGFYEKVKESVESEQSFLEKTQKLTLPEEILLGDSSPLIMQASVQVPELPPSLENQDSKPNIQNIEVNESSTTQEVNLVAESVQTVKSNLPVKTNIIQGNNNTNSITKFEFDDGTGSDPEFWGEVGETWARKFYKWLGYDQVDKQPDYEGFDFLCSGSNPKEIRSEVKARSSNNESIRLTLNEWSYLMNPENHDTHEILLILHKGERHQEFQSVFKIIRISQVWATFTNNFSKLIEHKTFAKYRSGEVEPLIALQLNSSGNANDLILNWKRLIDSIKSPNIKEYRPLSEVKFEEIRRT